MALRYSTQHARILPGILEVKTFLILKPDKVLVSEYTNQCPIVEEILKGEPQGYTLKE